MKKECEELDSRYKRYIEIDKLINNKREAAFSFKQLKVSSKTVEAKINLFQREIDDLEQEKVKLLGEMITDFEMVGDAKLYDVLKEYYVDGRTWKEISQSTGYAERYVMQLRNKALERIAKVLNKSE